MLLCASTVGSDDDDVSGWARTRTHSALINTLGCPGGTRHDDSVMRGKRVRPDVVVTVGTGSGLALESVVGLSVLPSVVVPVAIAVTVAAFVNEFLGVDGVVLCG